MDCHAGATMAAPAPRRHVNNNSVNGVIRSSQTSAAKAAESATMATSAKIRRN
jgi:hypothetical protein